MKKPRHPKGTPRGGQWKHVTADMMSSALPLALNTESASPQKATAVVKVGGLQRTLRHRDGKWTSRGLLDARTSRRLLSELDGGVDEAIEITSSVIAGMLNSGDLEPDEKLVEFAVRGVMQQGKGYAREWDWYKPTWKYRGEYIECSTARLAGLVHGCNFFKDTQIEGVSDQPLHINQICVMELINATRYTDLFDADIEFWHGTDGRLLHRIAETKIKDKPLVDVWEENPIEAAKAAPICAYLLGITKPDELLHQKSLRILNMLDKLHYENGGSSLFSHCSNVVSHSTTSDLSQVNLSMDKEMRAIAGELVSPDYDISNIYHKICQTLISAKQDTAKHQLCVNVLVALLGDPESSSAIRVREGMVFEINELGFNTKEARPWMQLLMGRPIS